MTTLFHGTSSNRIPGLLSEGFRGRSHWGTKEVAEIFADRECHDSGGRSVLIAIDLAMLDHDFVTVDGQMVLEPINTYAADADDRDLQKRWEASGQTWKDCLDIYESLVYTKPFAVTQEMLIG